MLRSELSADVEIRDDGLQYFEFDDTGFSLFVFTLTWVAGIPASVIANRIYDAMMKRSKKPPTRILIEKRMVKFDRGAITEAIEERIEVQLGSSRADDGTKA